VHPEPKILPAPLSGMGNLLEVFKKKKNVNIAGAAMLKLTLF